jgi:HK97 family phage major capsid protein
MHKIQELRKRRASLVDEARALLNDPTCENGVLSAEAQVRYDTYVSDINALGAQIQREEQMRDLEASMNEPQEVRSARGTREVSADEAQATEKRYAKAFRSYIARTATAEDIQILEARNQATTPGSAGGFLVPTDLYNQIMVQQAAFGGIRAAGATVLRTSAGNPMVIPTNNDIANAAVIVAENSVHGDQAMTFGAVTLGSYMYSTRVVKVSRQLAQDSAFDLDAFIRARFAERLGRGLGVHMISGDGTTQPQGFLANVSIGKQAGAGQATTVTYADLVDLYQSIDPAYRSNGAWLMNDTTLGLVMKLVDGQQRPLFIPSLALRAPDTILGQPLYVDNAMPSPATGVRSIAFGDFAEAYVIRDVIGMETLVLNELFATSAQIGFLGFSRHDAKVVNASAVKVYRHT